MHNAAFEALGIDAAYLAFDVLPERLAAAIEGVRALGIRQLAVSVPHKLAVIPLLDEVEETAERIGAVNTVTREGDRLVGSNTDWLGVIAALERRARAKLEGSRAVVLGAGGAARAAVFGLLERGAEVAVLNRTESKAADLARELGARKAGRLEELSALPYDVLVNTTSVGLRGDASPIPAAAIREGAVVLDAVYDPEETRLLRDARARGAKAVSGKWWLVHQAAAQLERWTRREAPIDAMAEAFDRAGVAPTAPVSGSLGSGSLGSDSLTSD
jgi:shikimate dehydrogenase